MGFVLLFLACAVITFCLALPFQRASTWIAWLVGSLPAAWLAVESRETLANPMTIFFILVVMWLPSIAGAFAGVHLARRLRGRTARG